MDESKPKSGRGGRRPGAGRKPGIPDRATQEQKATLEQLARTHTETALNVLVTVATKSESDAARVTAASALLDRGYGKPRQAHEHTGANGGPIRHDLSSFTDDQLSQLQAILGSNPHAGRGKGGDQEAGSEKGR